MSQGQYRVHYYLSGNNLVINMQPAHLIWRNTANTFAIMLTDAWQMSSAKRSGFYPRDGDWRQ